MVAMPTLKSGLRVAIEASYSNRQKPADYPTLRCSKIGESCERSLWYDLHFTTPLQRHEGRLERLFQTGHREERRMIEDLRAAGCIVHEYDLETGKQWRVSFLSGKLTGSCDGVVERVPGAEKTPHLLECKTHNDKSYQDWIRGGVEKSKPIHYAQMQIYMHGLGLTRALYLAHNKNTDEIECERVNYDERAANALIEKAARIYAADSPPEKNESFACRWCRHASICSGADWARMNCRTCLHFGFGDVAGKCAAHNIELTPEKELVGCSDHRWIPNLVPGEQFDFCAEGTKISYRLKDDVVFVDGDGFKPAAPEIEQ